MSSFLIFHNGKPIEVAFTELTAGTEKRYVITAGDIGTIAKQHNSEWVAIGSRQLYETLLQAIGNKILEMSKAETT